jgi:hypothetical protein
MGGAPATTTFRGITVDPTTADALTELARIVGDDIYLSPIPGCGSYQTSTKASAGTHAGGGAADINAENLTDEQARRIETRARSIGFVAYFRPRISPYSGNPYGWQRHVHMIRRDCTDLSPEARAQITAYDQGTDALAVPHKDTGSRAYVGMTWAKYVAAQKVAQEEDPLAGITVDQIVQAILNAQIKHPDPKRTDTSSLQSWVTRSALESIGANARASQLVARVAALEAVVKTIQANPNVTADQIAAAAKAGAEAALAEKIADADVTLNVTPNA